MRRFGVCLYAASSWACASAPLAPRAAPEGVPTFAVATYNVNFGLGGDPEGVAAIRRTRAQVVLLQETTPAWERALRAALSRRYPFMAFRHAGAAGGLGILSRHPFDDGDLIAPTVGWFPAWRVVVHSPVGDVQVLNVHLRPPVSDGGSFVSGYFSTPSLRRAEIASFFPALEPSLPTLVAGDFNEDEGGHAARWLEARGFRSVLPQYRPGDKTWRWALGFLPLSARLDHVFFDARLEPLEARVVKAGRSDHLPVFAAFVRRPQSAQP